MKTGKPTPRQLLDFILFGVALLLMATILTFGVLEIACASFGAFPGLFHSKSNPMVESSSPSTSKTEVFTKPQMEKAGVDQETSAHELFINGILESLECFFLAPFPVLLAIVVRDLVASSLILLC